MAVRLTETGINRALREAAEKGRCDLADVTAPGLRLRVGKTGGAAWVLACRDKTGGMRRFPLGAWPALGIADARKAAGALRLQVQAGADPIAERRRTRQQAADAKAGIGTLAALLDAYGGPRKPPGEGEPKPRVIGPGAGMKSWPDGRRQIENVFAKHLARPVASLDAVDLQATADAHPARQSASAATRYLRPILKWAAKRRMVSAGAAAIEPPATVGKRDRVLTVAELRAIVPALRDGADRYRQAMWFMLLTLARREEVCGATWGQVDVAAAEWTIPTTKNGQPHVVPLSAPALAMLRAIRPDGAAADAVVFATRSGGRLANLDRATKAVMADTGTAGWTRHDLRRTGATLLGEMGVEPHVIEAALNHTALHSQLAATYNRARYRPAVKAALDMLADRLDGIALGGAVVVPLRPAAASA